MWLLGVCRHQGGHAALLAMDFYNAGRRKWWWFGALRRKSKAAGLFPVKLLITIQPCSIIELKVILLIDNLPVTCGNSGTMD